MTLIDDPGTAVDERTGERSAERADQTPWGLESPMRVRKRNGGLEPIDLNKIVRAVGRAARGLDGVDSMRVAALIVTVGSVMPRCFASASRAVLQAFNACSPVHRNGGTSSMIARSALAACVAAASVLAKTTRDHLMTALHEKHPEYGFDVHKGYCTPTHSAALAEHGPSEDHRFSFVNVAAAAW